MQIKINDKINFSQQLPFVLIAGPCQIESFEHCLMIAEKLQSICDTNKVDFIFKSSFDKANRSSINSTRGVGLEKGLDILLKVKKTIGCPVLTDVHNPQQCASVAEVADIIQIPAFLCRQTDLLLAAADTKRVINIKKGQFLAPLDMQHVVKKIEHAGNKNILLCERGSCFGYNNLVSDFRSIKLMHDSTGYPVVFDATHSTQQPGAMGDSSGGQRQFAPVLARAALAVGVAGLFIETHQDPDTAPSDGATMIELSKMSKLIKEFKDIDTLTKTISS